MIQKDDARAIKQDCIEFFNRKRRELDFENGNFSELEFVNDQQKLTDPGVVDIMVEDEFDEDISAKEKAKEKSSYVTRAVVAHRRAGLNWQ